MCVLLCLAFVCALVSIASSHDAQQPSHLFVCFVFFCFFCLFCVLFSCFLSIASSHDAQQPPHQLAERLARVPQAHREELGGGALRARGVERVRHPRRLQPERREVVRPEGEAAQLAETLHEHLERRVDLRDWGEIGWRSWREIAEAIGDQIFFFYLFGRLVDACR